MRLAGKIGIVTAAASGMGRAGAVRFAREGAQVAVVKEIAAAGGTAHGIVADLTRDEDSRRIVWDAVTRFKGLDFVWNHVGHPGPAAVEERDQARHQSASQPPGGRGRALGGIPPPPTLNSPFPGQGEGNGRLPCHLLVAPGWQTATRSSWDCTAPAGRHAACRHRPP
jgi:hypothetical protein